MTLTFEHVTLGQRVLFGTGQAAANLAAEVERLEARAVMVIVSARERPAAEQVFEQVRPVLVHDDVVQHVPIENAERARALAADSGIDLVVCIGGGSTTGLAKAVALTSGIAIVAVPTTYAGSEATNVWGLTEGSRKTTGVDDRVAACDGHLRRSAHAFAPDRADGRLRSQRLVALRRRALGATR